MELQIKDEFKKFIPPLTVEEFKQLEDNCITEGIRDAIITWQGFIIDGHNRYEIAQKHGLKFRIDEKEFEREEQAKDWMDANQLGRRNLTHDQRKILIGRRYNRDKNTDRFKGNQYTSGGGKNYHNQKTPERLAKENNISEKTVRNCGKDAEKFDEIKEKQPELADKIWSGEISLSEIKKEEKKAERIEVIQKQIEDIESGILPELKGLYDVVSIDPPWPYEGNNKSITSFDAVGRRVANPYHEMSIQEIKEIELPLMNDAVVLLWTTHKFLPDAFDILKTWGLEYKATLVWNKEKIGMGAWLRMQCEFCLIGIKGKPYWNNTEHRDILNEPRREHSRKPDKFFELIEKITLGRRLEYFSREKRTGWEVYGNDINKF
jgi:N6-adenosine-specific RNA methylase IME4